MAAICRQTSARRGSRKRTRCSPAAGHDEGLGYYWWSLAGEKWVRLLAAEAAAACERGLTTSSAPGSIIGPTISSGSFARRTSSVPTPVPDAIERVRALQAQPETRSCAQAGAATTLARLLSMQGDFEQARELCEFGRDFYLSAGMATSAGGVTMHAAWIEERAGDLAAWEGALRTGYEELERLGTSELPLDCCRLSRTVPVPAGSLRRRRGAMPGVREAEPGGRSHQLRLHRCSRGLSSCPARVDDEDAAQLLRSAVERVETTDFVFARSASGFSYAETRSRAGQTTEAARSAALAVALLDDKGDVTGAERARERVAELGLEVT